MATGDAASTPTQGSSPASPPRARASRRRMAKSSVPAIKPGSSAFPEKRADRFGAYDVATTNTPAQQPWERLPKALEAIAQPQIVAVGGRKIVVSTIERRLHGVDLATGKPVWPPVQWGFEPDARPAIVAAHDGGAPIAIYISGRPHNGQSTEVSYKLEMTGIALDSPHQVWQTAIEETGVNVNTLGSPTDPPEYEIVPIGPHDEPAVIAPFGVPRRMRVSAANSTARPI